MLSDRRRSTLKEADEYAEEMDKGPFTINGPNGLAIFGALPEIGREIQQKIGLSILHVRGSKQSNKSTNVPYSYIWAKGRAVYILRLSRLG